MVCGGKSRFLVNLRNVIGVDVVDSRCGVFIDSCDWVVIMIILGEIVEVSS